MKENVSPTEEMLQLVDQLYDGKIDAVGRARLETLILQDRRNLQTYVERFDFHCELMDQADHKPLEITAMDLLQQSSRLAARRESRQHWRAGLLLLTCALLLAVSLGWIYYSTVLSRPAAGTIASLSMDLEVSSGSLELGQVIRERDTISIKSGIASIQLADVMIDLVGPASVRFERQGRVYLSGGTIVANVAPGGIGFTIKTPETEVIDLGTEFLVRHDPERGTYVSIRRGAAQARQLDWRGDAVKILDLTASRAAQFLQSENRAKEVAYSVNDYRPVDQSRGGINRLVGAIRTISEIPPSLKSDQFTTPNHLLVIPERQVTLTADLQVTGLAGPVIIPAGTTVSSYLIHYDPTFVIHSAPRGAVTFHGKIAAVIGSSSVLNATDSQFGLPEIQYESNRHRELEVDEDEVRVSDDRKTVSFFFGITPPELLDEARILVVHDKL